VAGAAVWGGWNIYLALHWNAAVPPDVWKQVAALVGLWTSAAVLLVLRVSWARRFVRVLAVIFAAGSLYSLSTHGSRLFFAVTATRALIYVTLFWLLRRPRAPASSSDS
jgi:hypothetical protein